MRDERGCGEPLRRVSRKVRVYSSFLGEALCCRFPRKRSKVSKLFEGKESRELFIAPAFAHARARYELFDTSFFAF